jgi:FixJ family two-component response regulator
VFADTVRELFRDLDEHDRGTASMLLQGYTAREIAAGLDCSERTIQRARGRLKQRLRRLYEA